MGIGKSSGAAPATYSDDLRQKAIKAVKRGERKREVSKMFNISRNTLDLWLKREQQTGKCEVVTNYQKGARHKISDWERFRAFAKQHGGKTQADGEVVGRQRHSAKHQRCFVQNRFES